ncbi:MAG: Na+/H+ antiporter NhaC family protein [Pseudohongiellaceae bacterium]
MTEPSWWSVIPPVLAIVLAILTRQVILSLGIGIWIGYSLLESLNPITGLASAVEGLVSVFSDPGDTRVLIFTLVIGGLIATIERLGGVRGFIRMLESRNWVNGPRGAQWLAYSTGIVIFIESNITLLVAGTVARPLFDRYKLAREKLAYIIDSTSAPVCILIPLNAWGATVIAFVEAEEINNPAAVFVTAIPFNFYPLIVIAFSALVIWRQLDIGPMRTVQQRTEAADNTLPSTAETDTADKTFSPAAEAGTADNTFLPVAEAGAAGGVPGTIVEAHIAEDVLAGDKARFMVLPILAMILSMPVGLYITGDGDIKAGSGSTSVLWAVLLGVLAAWLLSLRHRRLKVDELMHTFMQGAGNMLPISIILLFALALGDAANALGTGVYVAGVAQETLSPAFMLPLLFLVSAVIAFSIGSSWGTFAIMIPLAMQIVLALDYSPSLFLAAVLSGSVFGDHSSPISDTTVVASMASGTDHIDHVRTQLPYALLCAGMATAGFFLLGLVAL